MGLDVGERRIGVALSDPGGILASPLAVIDAHEAAAFEAIQALAAQHQVERLVVGMPRSLGGGLGPQAQAIQAFKEKLQARLSLPVDTWDERFSTVAAERILAEAGTKARKRKGLRDAVAAALVLQGYLDGMRASGR
ncbi:MAG TPA: Holliday junction resolvase RuvX [Dehalococcoidia bacterium]|nr:Holliday junction resolvase RuvX [Dehalococcoidia bacterium]